MSKQRYSKSGPKSLLRRCLLSLIAVCSGLLVGCFTERAAKSEKLARVHIVDRNGLKETVSVQNRLDMYAKNDFLSPQPYRQVVRTYVSNADGKTPSKMTTYHENGQVAEYIELINGRAFGAYRSWHPNGMQSVEAFVIEGMGALDDLAKPSWVFDGKSCAWDPKGNLAAEFYYDKGKLTGNALYYYPSGQVSCICPYRDGAIEGEEVLYSKTGEVIGKTHYAQGKKEGPSFFRGDREIPPYSEAYCEGKLIEGEYVDFSGEKIAQIHQGCGVKAIFAEGALAEKREYRNGIEEGTMRYFTKDGGVINTIEVKEGLKEGEEWVYYPLEDNQGKKPKLYVQWHQGAIHGLSRSWYPNGNLESEREFCDNKKHGVSSAWYANGALRLIETYENDLLKTGAYYSKMGESIVSTVENGTGTVTLYDSEGRFLNTVEYDEGRPLPLQ